MYRDTHPPVIHKNRPTNHILIVIAGISGSSIFETEARTSGKGLSSSSIASRSNSILLRGENEKGLLVSDGVGEAGMTGGRREEEQELGEQVDRYSSSTGLSS